MKKRKLSLSQLIKHCGEYFESLVQYSPGWWRANGKHPKYDAGTNWVDGCRTPEDAVRKLVKTFKSSNPPTLSD